MLAGDDKKKHIQTSFQKQTTIIIFDCPDGFDSDTFYNNIFFTIATVAMAEIPLYYKKFFFKNYCKMYLKVYIFCNANIKGI